MLEHLQGILSASAPAPPLARTFCMATIQGGLLNKDSRLRRSELSDVSRATTPCSWLVVSCLWLCPRLLLNTYYIYIYIFKYRHICFYNYMQFRIFSPQMLRVGIPGCCQLYPTILAHSWWFLLVHRSCSYSSCWSYGWNTGPVPLAVKLSPKWPVATVALLGITEPTPGFSDCGARPAPSPYPWHWRNEVKRSLWCWLSSPPVDCWWHDGRAMLNQSPVTMVKSDSFCRHQRTIRNQPGDNLQPVQPLGSFTINSEPSIDRVWIPNSSSSDLVLKLCFLLKYGCGAVGSFHSSEQPNKVVKRRHVHYWDPAVDKSPPVR